MKKTFKKLMALGLVGAMVMGLATGCAKKGESNQATNNDNAATETEGFADYSTGFAERVTIQIPVYDRAFEGWNVSDNYYTQWIQSEFGDKYNVDVEFVGIGRASEVTDFTMLLASGKAPNVIFHYDMPQALSYYNEGAMQKINLEEVANYAPTYAANLGETNATYGTVDGDNYFFFAERPEAYNWVTLIRQDWLDAVGMDMPTSLEEYNAVLTAWKAAGLGNGGGTLIQNSYSYDYEFRSWPIDEKERALYSDLSVADFTTDASYKFLKNLNYQYNNGLIDSEFYLNTDDASTQADFVSGNSGIYSFYLSSSSTVLDNLTKNDPNAEVAVMPATAKTPEGNVPQSRGFWPFGLVMGINADTTKEERIAVWMYLEWMSQPENLFYLQNGVEGQNYTLDESGLAVKNNDYTGESKLSNNNNKDYWALVVESAQYEDPELNHKANVANWAPIGYENLIEDAYNYYYEFKEYETPDALFSVVLSNVTDYKSDLNDLWKELYVKVVRASEADFEKVYADSKEIFLDSGYQDILDEKQEAIDNGQYN